MASFVLIKTCSKSEVIDINIDEQHLIIRYDRIILVIAQTYQWSAQQLRAGP